MSDLFVFPNIEKKEDVLFLGIISFYVISCLLLEEKIPFLSRSGFLMSYSKFAKNNGNVGPKVPSKIGMTLLYFPSAMLGICIYLGSFGLDSFFPTKSRTFVLTTLHFAKRTLECLFLHKYSGSMPLSSSIFISSLYILTVIALSFFVIPEEEKNSTMQSIGTFLFVVGMIGNYYHHYLLAKLRQPGDKSYKVPVGGLFEYVAAPHYLFEIIDWFGMAIVSQHFMNIYLTIGMTGYLMQRSIAQTKWNQKNLKEKYPKERKHLIPFIF